MVFTFDFVTAEGLDPDDEEVSLEMLEDGVTPKPPSESRNDGLPKLYVRQNAFMKVLGSTLDVEVEKNGVFLPIVLDREGNRIDPNA